MEPMESFVFYYSFFEAMEDLTDEQELALYRAISKYALCGEESQLSGVTKLAFTLIKPQLEANRQKRLYGAKGGRPPKNSPPKINGSKTKKPKDSKKETDGYSDKEPNDKHKETTGFQKNKPNVNVNENKNGNKNINVNIPTLDEVISYAISRGREDLAEKFFEYYNVGNWLDKDGKPVLNWKQKFITWERNNPKPEKKKRAPDDMPDWNDPSQFFHG